MREGIQSLYSLKAVCAFFIICIHCSFIGKDAFLPIIKIAVPCFYIISGFFLVDNNGSIQLEKVIKQIKKLLLLILTANCVYLIVTFITEGLNVSHLLQIKSIIRLCFYGDVIAVHLWFLNAYVEGLLIVLLLIKIKGQFSVSLKHSLFIGVLLLTAPLFGRYSFILCNQFDEIWFRNCFNIAIPFMFIGAIIRKHQNDILLQYKRLYILITIFVFLFLSYVEYGFQFFNSHLNIVGDLNFFTIPLSIFVFLLCLSYQDLSLKKWWCGNISIAIGRYHSANIYLYHFIFIDILTISSSWMESKSPLIPITILLLSLLLSFMINKNREIFSSNRYFS